MAHCSRWGDSRPHDARVPTVTRVPQGYISGPIEFGRMHSNLTTSVWHERLRKMVKDGLNFWH